MFEGDSEKCSRMSRMAEIEKVKLLAEEEIYYEAVF